MSKMTVKGFGSVFLSYKSSFAIILLLAVAIAMSCVDVIIAETGGQMTLLNTSVAEIDAVGQGVLNELGSKGEVEQRRPDSTVDKTATHSESSGEWQSVLMRVTAYCPCPKCCGRYSDGETACGHKIRPGEAFVAADRNYRFGTEMIVAGYNDGEPVKVLDRGGAIYGNRLDVFFNSHEDALKWGVKHVDVKVRHQ